MHIIGQHLHLADQCAKKWYKYDSKISYDDYYQEACIGLIMSAKRFDSSFNAKFSSYAFMAMNGAIKTMRAFWYTGRKEGFNRNYPVPTWELIDHCDDEYVWELGHYGHDYAIREEIKALNLHIEDIDISKQQEKQKYLAELKNILFNNNISHSTLATWVGVSQSTITRWLGGTGLNDKKMELIDLALKRELLL